MYCVYNQRSFFENINSFQIINETFLQIQKTKRLLSQGLNFTKLANNFSSLQSNNKTKRKNHLRLRMNILSNLQQIANIIIRPSRYTYKITDLGNKAFKIEDKQIKRQDFQLKNPRGLKIKCSIYTSQKDYKQIQKCIIYLHCNSGCRVQGLAYLKQALDQDFSYVVFDFTGSGLSQGKYVSLGFYETIDLQCVYDHIKSIISEKAKLILWGRSMGAVTGLNFLLNKKHNISFAIFDSPFKSLKDLFIQIGKQKTSFPEFLLEMAYNYIKPIILEKAGFNIEEVDLKFQKTSINCPCVFIASKQDSLVPYQQIDEIFSLYKGEKEMHFIEQGHNEARNPKVIKQVFKALKKHLHKQEENERLRLQQQQIERKNYNSSNYQKQKNQNIEKKELSRRKLQLTIKSLSQRQLLSTMVGKIVLSKDEDLTKQRRVSNLGLFQSKQNQNIIKLKVRQEKNPSLQKNSNPSIVIENNNSQINQQLNEMHQNINPVLQKKPLSCLLPHKKSLKALSFEENEINRLSFQPQTQRKILNINKSESKLKIKKKPMQIKNFFGNQKSHNFTKQANVEYKIRYQPLGERKLQNNILSQRQVGNKVYVVKNISVNKAPNLSESYRFQKEQKQNLNQSKKFNQQNLNDSFKIDFKSLSLRKQIQEPHSDIKTQSNTKNKINIHQDFIREKQFLKRSESLEKVLKLQNIAQKKLLNDSTVQTYREIKCTERVLQKIIEKQQRKLLILNLQQINNQKQNQIKNSKKTFGNEKKQTHLKTSEQQNQGPHKKKVERKTLQHIVNKKKPFVQLKGIKNYRNSMEQKYKTQVRK